MARHGVITKFLKVKCKDCENEQIVFAKAATKISCNVCNAAMVEPKGGHALVLGEVIAELS